ncbi:DNA repair exonuclease [Rhizobium leguminosarum bv. trifolii WSM2297]|uniref:DNA repair exonuclease n=1 Tax=Rhizobium leguminosarum bv. trifolii WSM2297 TaxID=754762 RepID=J0WEZ0_RHILT|nr:DNA repair exonuclease [Rhizobium leguminosarum]EJC83853.1 DNA repair exonuclease [Rhizobium leguminosarum bv. trifolii WSM2297]EJC84556.1 DNA repair exonuclease [Rhizobium leguminosarum bv. trifolii WSM2297]
MAYRFIHTADLHLDSPLRSLALRNADLADLVSDASRQALVAIVDLCLEERVDALVIAGDLYDGEQTSMKTARFLASQLERLHRAGIYVFKIRGNHDAMSKIARELVMPDTVKIFGGHAEIVEATKGSLSVAIHGMSFAKPHAPDPLLPKFKPPVAGAVNIGIMHTSLAGSAGHDVYAPCNVLDLHASGFDYWALGHLHQRSHHPGAATIIMPGMPQGRDINESGVKTVSLVTVADDRTVTVEERRTSVAQFERVDVDLTGVDDWRDAAMAVEVALTAQRDRTASPHLVARLKLSGRTQLSWQLRRDVDLMQAEAEQRGDLIGRTWIEKLELAFEAPLTLADASAADPVVGLAALMRDEVIGRSGFRDDIREVVRDLLADLPAESRAFAGHDEAGFERFIDNLLANGAEDIAARMKAADRVES